MHASRFLLISCIVLKTNQNVKIPGVHTRLEFKEALIPHSSVTGVEIEGKKPFLHLILATQPNPQGVDETLKLTPVALVGQSTSNVRTFKKASVLV